MTLPLTDRDDADEVGSAEGSGAGRALLPRLLLGLGGLTLMGVGALELLAFDDVIDLLWLAGWLAVGVFLHDGVLAPVTAVGGRFFARRWHIRGRVIPIIAGVSIVSLTLLALPLLGRQGSVAGNPTLLGRNYLLGWASACMLVVLGALLAESVRQVRANRARRDGPHRESLRRL